MKPREFQQMSGSLALLLSDNPGSYYGLGHDVPDLGSFNQENLQSSVVRDDEDEEKPPPLPDNA